MARRLFFFGLTLVLAAALIGLIIRGRRMEKEPVAQVMEKVEQSEPSATRVLKPQDLEIKRSSVRLKKREDGARPTFTAWHQLEIFNRGTHPYRAIQLSFTYSIRNNKGTEKRNHLVAQTLLPGATLKLADIRIEGLPESTAGSQITIAYADMETASPQKR